jgi:uncharacterized FlaG/YvyC family protein
MPINAIGSFSEYNPAFQQNIEKLQELQEKVKVEKPIIEAIEPKIENNEQLDQLKSVLTENNINLEFSQDSETKQLIVKLVNSKTGEEIRQLPSEISLKLAAVFVKMKGQFVDTKE